MQFIENGDSDDVADVLDDWAQMANPFARPGAGALNCNGRNPERMRRRCASPKITKLSRHSTMSGRMRPIIPCSITPNSSNKIIQKGLAFLRRQSGTVAGFERRERAL
jgi:hypothetical protein